MAAFGTIKSTSFTIDNLGFGSIGSRSLVNGTEYGTIVSSLNCNQIQFSNPSYTHKIWRSGVAYNATASVPIGYTCNWSIVNHETRAVQTSGATTAVSWTPTFARVDVCNTYDLIVVATRGAKTFTRVFPGEITVYPQDPGTYTTTYNTSGDKNGGWTNRAGQSILVTGSLTRINMYHFKSDDPTNWLYIKLHNLDIQTATNIISFGITAFQNVVIDGCTDETVQYGCVIQKLTGAASQMVNFLGAEPNDNTKLSKNVMMCGIDCNGNNIVGAGITAFRILNNRDAANNETTFTFDRLTVFNCRGRNTYEETWYLGQSSDYTSGGLRYPYYTNCYYYNLIGENGGNEVWQFGLHRNSEVFKCSFKNGGTRNQNSHENLVQWSNGNRNCAFYMNYLEQGTHNLLAFFSGETGKDNEFFSNVMYTDGKDADGGGNIWAQAQTGSIEATLNVSFFHNTIIWAAGVSAFTLYEAFVLDWNKFNAVENIVIGATTTDYENASGVDPTHVVFSNYKLLTANIGDALFVDHANKDYHLSRLTSPAFGASTSITKVHPLANYDYEGVEFIATSPVRGAFSGYELMTLEIEP